MTTDTNEFIENETNRIKNEFKNKFPNIDYSTFANLLSNNDIIKFVKDSLDDMKKILSDYADAAAAYRDYLDKLGRGCDDSCKCEQKCPTKIDFDDDKYQELVKKFNATKKSYDDFTKSLSE